MKKLLVLALCMLLLVSSVPFLSHPASMITRANLNVDKQYAFVGDMVSWTTSHYMSGSGNYNVLITYIWSSAGGAGQDNYIEDPISGPYYDSTGYTVSSQLLEAGYYMGKAVVTDLLDNSSVIAYSPVTSVSLRPAPQITKIEAVNGTTLKLAWTAVSDATGYEVWRATSPNGPYTLTKRTSGTATTNPYLKPGTLYYYKIRTYNQFGRLQIASGAYSKVSTGVPLNRSAITSISNIGRDRITLTWSKPTGANYYQVLRSSSAFGTYSVVKTLAGNTTVITGLKPNTSYYFKVLAFWKNYANYYYAPLSPYRGVKTLR